jgi:hypothetical protein
LPPKPKAGRASRTSLTRKDDRSLASAVGTLGKSVELVR